jgi:hypothetical protein
MIFYDIKHASNLSFCANLCFYPFLCHAIINKIRYEIKKNSIHEQMGKQINKIMYRLVSNLRPPPPFRSGKRGWLNDTFVVALGWS